MDAALRLLLALRGGRDGRTFRLDDPTRVAQDVRQLATENDDWSSLHTVGVVVCVASQESSRRSSGRLGERIRMKDVRLVLASSALFATESMPLQQKRCVRLAALVILQRVVCHSDCVCWGDDGCRRPECSPRRTLVSLRTWPSATRVSGHQSCRRSSQADY